MSLFDLSPKSAVVVAPHADDEVLGAGGLILRLRDAGWDVHVAFATISGFASGPRGDRSTTSARELEAQAALAALGVADYDALYRGEDMHLRLDTAPQADLIAFIEGAIAAHRPSLVVVPALGDHHQDHRATARACHAALRPAPSGRLPFVPRVLAYGQSGPAGWGGRANAFHPTVFVNIDAVIDRKLAAMEAYASQLCPPPHARSLPWLRSAAAVHGAQAGCRYAEAFECLRHVVA